MRLRVSDQPVPFSLWPTTKGGRGYVLQPEVFSTTPWDVIEFHIKKKFDGRSKLLKVCLSFLEQAKNFYLAAEQYSSASKPLLLYYSFMNLAKAYIIFQGIETDLDRAEHGVAEDKNAPRAFTSAAIKVFRASARHKNLVDLLGQALGVPPMATDKTLKIVKHIAPQIVIGHLLWAAASGKKPRFIRCEAIELRHSRRRKEVWLRIAVTRDDLRACGVSHTRFAKLAKLHPEFREVAVANASLSDRCVVYEQITPISYPRRPSDKVHELVACISPILWNIVRSIPPYRRYYVSLPSDKRLHPLLAIYGFVFYLGSVTRYRPHEFEKIQNSKYGMLVSEFLSTHGQQFWYHMACEFSQQRISLPAIVR